MGKPTVSAVLGMVFACMLAAPVFAEKKAEEVKRSITAQDSIETGNLVVQHNACIGTSCSTTDANFSALKLKSVEPNLLFDDIEVPEGGSSSSHDWALFVNFNDVDQFSIVDFGNGLLPFNIAAGAPTDSLDVAASGNVGLGTATPSEQLHVTGSAGTSRIMVEETSATAAGRALLRLRNNGGPFLIWEDTSLSKFWSAGSVSTNFLISEGADNTVEFRLSNTGNLTITGVLTQGSDRSTKREIVPIEPEEVLAKLDRLPISTWNRKTDLPSVRHMGPMAQDFAAIFGLGEDDLHIATIDMAGVSMAAIQALHAGMQQRDAEVATLRRENADLGERVKALEALVSSIAARQSAPGGEPAPERP
jgi:hypothetical protein